MTTTTTETYLSDILNVEALNAAVKLGFVRVVSHPSLPIRIYNYTAQAQYQNMWTHEIRAARGLIVGPNDEIIARGPSKFFNYSQPGAVSYDLSTKVWVTPKEDGSLGIGWYFDGHYGIATRGSFTSDQAVHATKMIDIHKATIRFAQMHGRSAIFEIVYPENRIVLDYNGLDKLIKLGQVDNTTGLITVRNLGELEKTKLNQTFGYEMTLMEAILLPIADDAEGYVLDIIQDDKIVDHLKLKGARYKELHAAIFGLSERRIWEKLGEGIADVTRFIEDLPDELQPWANDVLDNLTKEIVYYNNQIDLAFNEIQFELDPTRIEDPEARKDIAKLIKERYAHLSGPLFAAIDKNETRVSEWVHSKIRPGHKLFRVESQDNN